MNEIELKTDHKKLLAAYAEYYTQEQCAAILELIDVAQNGFFYRNNNPCGIDDTIMKRLGYKSYDTAKPATILNSWREQGIPEEIFRFTVWDYTQDRIWGKLSNYLIRYFSDLHTKLT